MFNNIQVTMTKVNILLSFSMMIVSAFTKEWALSAAWFSSFCGWTCLAIEENKNKQFS